MTAASNDILIKFGNRLREARERKGFSQEKLGDLMGVSLLTAHYWEQGRFLPQAHRLPELASYLDVSIDWLFGMEEKFNPIKEIIEKLEQWVLDNYNPHTTSYTAERSRGNCDDCFFDGEDCGRSWAALEVGTILGVDLEEPEITEE